MTLVLMVSGCDSRPAMGVDANKYTEVYRPPTAIHQTPLVMSVLNPTFDNLISTQHTTAVPACTDGLKFIDDITIPDGTQVAPGDTVDKRWLVENAGTCDWNEQYRLKLVIGGFPGVTAEQALYPARSGTQAALRIFFVAPDEFGTYQIAWEAFNSRVEPFGDNIFVEIVVGNNP